MTSSHKNCRNCKLSIHSGFTSCPICKTDSPFLQSQECSICFDNISTNDIHTLKCSHTMHKNCYKNFMLSSCSKKCPMCRTDIHERLNICQLCNKELDLDPSQCTTIRSKDCGCLYHYQCLKDYQFQNKINYLPCKRCEREVNVTNVEPLSYLYLQNGYNNWIGNLPRCKIGGCSNTGNAKRLGYCIQHGTQETTNKAIIMAFGYFIKYVVEMDMNYRQNIFQKLVDYMNINHRYDDVDTSDFENIKNKIEHQKILL